MTPRFPGYAGWSNVPDSGQRPAAPIEDDEDAPAPDFRKVARTMADAIRRGPRDSEQAKELARFVNLCSRSGLPTIATLDGTIDVLDVGGCVIDHGGRT